MSITPAAAMITARAEGVSSASTLMGLMWLASPALPVGGFSYSEGLEAAVESGLVHDDASTSRWLREQLHLVLSRSELPLLARAVKAWQAHDEQEIRACNDWVLHTRETRELRLQTEQMGRSLAHWMAQRVAHESERGEQGEQGGQGDPCDTGGPGNPGAASVDLLQRLPGGPTWPVAYALACTQAAATPEQALLAMAFSWAENQMQAAIKCVPLGQAAGQRVLADVTRDIEAAVSAAMALVPAPAREASQTGTSHQGAIPQAFAPGLAILSARHEEQYSRLFRS